MFTSLDDIFYRFIVKAVHQRVAVYKENISPTTTHTKNIGMVQMKVTAKGNRFHRSRLKKSRRGNSLSYCRGTRSSTLADEICSPALPSFEPCQNIEGKGTRVSPAMEIEKERFENKELVGASV